MNIISARQGITPQQLEHNDLQPAQPCEAAQKMVMLGRELAELWVTNVLTKQHPDILFAQIKDKLKEYPEFRITHSSVRDPLQNAIRSELQHRFNIKHTGHTPDSAAQEIINLILKPVDQLFEAFILDIHVQPQISTSTSESKPAQAPESGSESNSDLEEAEALINKAIGEIDSTDAVTEPNPTIDTDTESVEQQKLRSRSDTIRKTVFAIAQDPNLYDTDRIQSFLSYEGGYEALSREIANQGKVSQPLVEQLVEYLAPRFSLYQNKLRHLNEVKIQSVTATLEGTHTGNFYANEDSKALIGELETKANQIKAELIENLNRLSDIVHISGIRPSFKVPESFIEALIWLKKPEHKVGSTRPVLILDRIFKALKKDKSSIFESSKLDNLAKLSSSPELKQAIKDWSKKKGIFAALKNKN